jgi:hypothetical protein
MSDNVLSRFILRYSWREAFPVFRYAVGTTIIFAFSAGYDYMLAYITPVLALSFFAPGVPPLSFRAGIGFILSVALSCFLGFMFGWFLILLHLFYSATIKPLLKVWLLISLFLIPLLSTLSYQTGAVVSISLVINAIVAVILVWFVFTIFPFSYSDSAMETKKAAVKSTPAQRFRMALINLIIVFPVVIMYYMFLWTESILVLIFIAVLSINPKGSNFKAGMMLILANLAGGVSAILAYNLLVVVPDFFFLILITLVISLYFGEKVYSGKPTASLYGTAFSTYLLVLGSVTASEGDAGEKVWDRILQIGIAVTYVVLANWFLHRISNSNKTSESNESL